MLSLYLQLAEKMGLAHISKGVDRERHIEVSKPGKSVSQENQSEGDSLSSVSQSEQFLHRPEDQSKKVAQRKIDNQPPKENDGNVIDTTNVKSAQPRSVDISEVKVKDPGKDACRWCGKNIIKANVQLHELGCPQNPHKKQRPCSASSKKQEPFSKSSAPRRFDKELAKKVNSVDSDDIDALIATVQKMDKFCCFKKCKTSVQTLCNVCNFCQGRYCMSHHMPEIHGCGDAARAEARARISKDGVLYRGSGVPSKKSDEAKKAHLQKKLDNKLTEMSAKRKMKQKK